MTRSAASLVIQMTSLYLLNSSQFVFAIVFGIVSPLYQIKNHIKEGVR